MKYLVFTINSFRLALDINKIFEVVIPGLDGNTSSEKMLAEKSMTYQGKQIPIIIFADFLFNISTDRPDDFRVILCEINGKPFGLLVDNADKIVRLSQENIISVEKGSPEIKTDYFDGKFLDDEKEIFIIAPDKILSVVETI